MRKNRFVTGAISVILVLATVLSTFLSVPVFADGKSGFDPDFGDAGGSYNVSFMPSELIRELYGDISEQEAAYVDTYFESVLLYNKDISAENVSVEVSGATVKVAAEVKTYVANNGATVSWIPAVATYGESSLSLEKEGDAYVCEFTLSEATVVTVKYSARIELDGDYVDSVANFAYNDLSEASEILAEHSAALNGYLEAYENYQNYLTELDNYNNRVAEYTEYLEKKKIYDERLAEYNAYVAALAKYKADLAAYEKYKQDYEKYLVEKAKYDEDYKKYATEYSDYVAYMANLAKIRTSMAAIESIYVTPSNGYGPMFGALQNAEIIALIEKHQNIVTLYGCTKEDIVNMRAVSDQLTQLLVDYKSARETSEEAAFAFYKQHYTDICYKFNYLYDKMETILSKTLFVHVCTIFEIEYADQPGEATRKKNRIRNVLCHIYMICHALDDKSSLGTSWKFYQDNGEEYEYAFSELLGQNVIITDNNNANPAGLEWIHCETPDVAPPVAPTMPTEVKEPTAPREVNEPAKVPEVTKPGAAPESVDPPSERPQIENYELVLRTQEHLDGAQLTQREALTSPVLVLEREVARVFSPTGNSVTAYYDYDGTLLSATSTVPSTPTRRSTAEYEFVFDGWEQISGGNDRILVAKYMESKRKYTVTFKAYADSDEVLYTYESDYGEMAKFVGQDPAKDSTNTHVYEFTGWYPSLSAVKADTLFVAQFKESDRLYDVSWSILGNVQTRGYTYGAEVIAPSVRDKQYVGGTMYEFIGWDKEIGAAVEAVTYTAQFNVTPLVSVPDQTGQGIEIYHDGEAYVLTLPSKKADVYGLLKRAASDGSSIVINAGGATFHVSAVALRSLASRGAKTFEVLGSVDDGIGYVFTDSNGEDMLFVGDVVVGIQNTLGTTENLYVSFVAPPSLSGTDVCSANAATVEFVAQPRFFYRVNRYYSITVAPAEGGSVFANASLLKVGEKVRIEAKPNSDCTLERIYYTDSEGNVTEIDSTGVFVMPSSDVTVTAEFLKKTYKVTFVSFGEVISEKTYPLGATVEIPDIALSFEKDGYIYSFIGWSKTVTYVMEDAVYTAKYSSVRAELKLPPNTQSALSKVLISQVLPIGIGIVVISAAITTLIIMLKRRKRKRKGDKK